MKKNKQFKEEKEMTNKSGEKRERKKNMH